MLNSNPQDINIFYHLPVTLETDQTLDEQDIKQIEQLSNDFAQLLLLLNKGLLKSHILDQLNNQKKNSLDNPQKTLFIDNILSCYDLAKKEYNIIKAHNDEPVIRPLIAFNHYQ